MRLPIALASLPLIACAGAALYPPRPPAIPGPPIADPAPAKVVAHITLSAAELRRQLEWLIPPDGEGAFVLLGSSRRYTWKRSPLSLSFDEGRVGVQARVIGVVTLFGQPIELPVDLVISAEPILTADYRARLQSLRVRVESTDGRIRMAQDLAGALDTLRGEITTRLSALEYDLRPAIAEAWDRLARPIDLAQAGAIAEAHGCARLRITGIEAGPTVLAGGIEKDFAMVVAPSVTLPCAPETNGMGSLPPLANVSSLPSGPFTVTVPIAARYEELAEVMKLAFTDGKLYFSKEFPALYLDRPEVYAAADQLVLKLHIGGPLAKAGIHTVLDGDIFLYGHPTVVDNELRVPDLQPTIETTSFLLKLKAALDGDSIRDQARAALKLDLGARFQSVRAKLSTDLAFGSGAGCLRSEVSRMEVTGVYPHASYLRLYLTLTAEAAVYLPCPAPAVGAR